MSREFLLAGIGGYRADLSYNPIEDRSAVAENEEERRVVKSAVTGKPLPFSRIMGRHTGGMVSETHDMIDIMDGCTARIVIGKDACMKDGDGNNMMTKVAISSATNVGKKDEFEKFAADLVREYIAPLVKNVQRLTALNAELASKVKEMEKRLGDKATVQPVSPAPEPEMPIREVSWGDQGGLPNFLPPQNNPFCGKRRG